MKIVGIIPARGGSTRIQNKNTRLFHGKPLIAWSILAALKSKKLDKVIVFTDNDEIADIARQYGAEAPFKEPAELATGVGGIEPVLKDAYEKLKAGGYEADAVVLMQSTNPFRQSFHIDEAIEIFEKGGCDSVVSVNETPANHTPYWTLTKNDETGAVLFGGKSLKEILDRRQDFPEQCYARNDLIYVFKPKNLYEEKPNLYGDKVELYHTSPLYEIDINTDDEWEDAEFKFELLRAKSKLV